MEESSELERLMRGEEGVEGKACAAERCSACAHLASMDENADRGRWDWRSGGMDRESTGASPERGVGGRDEGEGVGGGNSRRELERLRPSDPRVRGGRTLVEDARCLF